MDSFWLLELHQTHCQVRSVKSEHFVSCLHKIYSLQFVSLPEPRGRGNLEKSRISSNQPESTRISAVFIGPLLKNDPNRWKHCISSKQCWRPSPYRKLFINHTGNIVLSGWWLQMNHLKWCSKNMRVFSLQIWILFSASGPRKKIKFGFRCCQTMIINLKFEMLLYQMAKPIDFQANPIAESCPSRKCLTTFCLEKFEVKLERRNSIFNRSWRSPG